jgi:hypothetical protein
MVAAVALDPAIAYSTAAEPLPFEGFPLAGIAIPEGLPAVSVEVP